MSKNKKHKLLLPTLVLGLSGQVYAAGTDATLSAITVQGDDTTTTSHDSSNKTVTLGALGEHKLMDTPYSVTTMSKDIIDTLQLKKVKDVLSYMPSVQGDGTRPQTRGIQGSVVQNSMMDGLNIVATTDYPAEQFERIEVLNGLAGSLYGPANPAGIFNYVSKRPREDEKKTVSLGFSTGFSTEVGADLSGKFDEQGRFKYRLTLMNDEGSGYTSDSTRRRQFIGLATDFKLSPDTVLETNVSHYHYLAKGLPGSFALGAGLAFPNALDPTSSKYGQSYAGDDNTTDTISAHLKHQINDNWHLDIGMLRQIADRESTAVTNTFTNNKGNYTTSVSTSTASRFTIDSYLATLNGTEYTGSLRHDLSLGFRGFIWNNYNPVNGGALTLGKASLSNPQSFAEPNYPDFTNRYQSAGATQKAFILGDTLTFNQQWGLLLSGSQNYLTSTNYSKTSAVTSQSNNQGLSGAASLTYKPWQPLMLYATYADSLQQGDTAPSGASNAGTILAPYRSKQKEVGAKWSLDQINLTLAGFRIERPYAYTQNGTYAVAGNQVNHGLEFMADGNIGKQLYIFGGVTWLDPKLQSTGNSSTENRQIVGLSKITANLLTIYHLDAVPGVDLNANVHYMGKRPTDNANTYWVKAYTTFDLGTSYTTKLGLHSTVFRLEMTNVGNEHYWTNIVPGALTGYTGTGYATAQLGAPRTLEGSVSIDF